MITIKAKAAALPGDQAPVLGVGDMGSDDG
jgi:hypothetical protein